MKLYSILSHIEKRPKMYFREVNTLALESFISGFHAGHECNSKHEECGVCEFHQFHDWVKCRLHSDKTGLSWRDLLLEHYDDEIAFKKFFELVDEFKNRNFEIIAELLNTKIVCRQEVGGEAKQIPITSKIQLGKYTDDPGYWLKISGLDECRLSGFYRDLEFLEMFIGISRADWTIYDQSAIK